GSLAGENSPAGPLRQLLPWSPTCNRTHWFAAGHAFVRHDFMSYTESTDTSTAVGRMVFTMVAAVAEMERSLIRERVQAGVDRARRQGKKLGRPRVLVDEEKIREEMAAWRNDSGNCETLGRVTRRRAPARWP